MSQPELETPEQILAAMGEAYASCRSYYDTGCVVTRWYDPDGTRRRVDHKPFTTAFLRPDRFRYQGVTLNGGRYVVWAEGETVHRWWDMRPDRNPPEDLMMAIAGATGVSAGSAHTIPTLLLPERIGGRRLTELIDLVRLPDGVTDGVECYQLQGQSHTDPALEEARRQAHMERTGRSLGQTVRSPHVLWIDKRTLLLIRLDRSTQFDTFRTDTVATYDPVINVRIPDEQFGFDPSPKPRRYLRGSDGETT